MNGALEKFFTNKTHFKVAYIKLTLFYVLIIMTISLSFSLALHQISTTEIHRGLGRQNRALQDLRINKLPQELYPFGELESIRDQLADESSRRLLSDLIYFNLLILIFSSIASYFFAKRTLEPIEQGMEAQNRFTADASHELRTPLAAIRSEIEVNLRDKHFNINQARELLKSNLEEVGKLEALSASLLRLSHMEDRSKIELIRQSLSELIIEAYEKVERLASKKAILFENNLKDLQIIGNKESLIELFVILLDNAIKYSPEKSKIEINIWKKERYAIAEIKDQGTGIKSSDLPYIFNRFYRADNSRTKSSSSGYGLGLSIAKQIADLNKADIVVKSAPGKGSSFKVVMPIYRS